MRTFENRKLSWLGIFTTTDLHKDRLNITKVHNTLAIFSQCLLHLVIVTKSDFYHLPDHFQLQSVTVEKTEAVAAFQ